MDGFTRSGQRTMTARHRFKPPRALDSITAWGIAGRHRCAMRYSLLQGMEGNPGRCLSASTTRSKRCKAKRTGPKIAFGLENRVYAAWSIPGAKGDKTRANIRFSTEDGKGGFTPGRTVNEIRDAARFPIIEFAPDGNVLLAWIDRRIDNPKPRQLYLLRLGPDGKELTKNLSSR